MVGAEHQAHHVRNEEADVTDGAADGNSEAGEKRSGEINQEAHVSDVHAEMHGLFFSREKNIQIIGGRVDHADGNEKAGGEKPVDAFLKGKP